MQKPKPKSPAYNMQPAYVLAPFNVQYMTGMANIVATLLEDPQFATPSVLVPFTCGTFGVSFACGFAVMVNDMTVKSDYLVFPHSSYRSKLWAA